MIRFAMIAAAMLLPAAAQAQDWRLASEGESTGSAFFVDVTSIVKSGNLARGTAFMIMPPDRGIAAIETVLEFDCKSSRKRIINMRPYDTSEKPMQLYDGSNTWEDTPRETQFGAVMEVMCGTVALPTPSHGKSPPFAAWRELSKD